MPLTTALYTGMSGLAVNQTALDVIGNNISNVNTTAFKGARALFQPEFSETYSFGTQPGDTFGGTNPSQKGLGVRVGAIQRNMESGNIKLTGLTNDLAIDGDGMFIIEDSERSFTRDGQFQLNSDNYLVTADGRYVMGYSIDDNYNVVEGSLTRMQIPVNRVTVASATSSVVLDGTLGGDSATIKEGDQGTLLTSCALVHSNGTDPITSTTFLSDVMVDNSAAGGVDEAAFTVGNTLQFEGERGEAERKQGPRTMEIEATTTVQDYLDFMVNAYGINVDPTITPAGVEQAEGYVQDNGDGTFALAIRGNVGEENALKMGTGALSYTDGSSVPLIFQTTEKAVGTSTYSSFEVYDSLGNPLTVELTFVLKDAGEDSGRTWQFFANSLDDTDTSTVLGSGEIVFDTDGQFVSATNTTIQLDRENNGVTTPMAVELDMTLLGGVVQDGNMSVQLSSQDGEAAGTLNGYSFSQDGSIIGSFTNGSTRVLGQMALATFSNYSGLIDAGSNTFKVGPNSGVATIGVPGSNGSGSIFSQAVETSNVDISREFIDLITASTGFSAASKIITTSDELINQLLSLVR